MPYGSAHAGDAQSTASQVDRSITPLLQEAMDPNFFYQPNAYASPAYYFPTVHKPVLLVATDLCRWLSSTIAILNSCMLLLRL